MTLPVLKIAKQQVEVPVINKTYTIRPYLVGEEKAILMAFESKDDKTIETAIKNLLESCIDEKVNIDDLSYFETEYLFIQLRKISVNNVVEIGLKHKHDDKCNHIQRIKIDLNNIKTSGSLNNKILLDEDAQIGVIMKIPTNKVLSKKYDTETEKAFGMIEESIESIFDAENLYNVAEVSKQELRDWINQLNNEQINQIAKFFSDLPSLYYDVEYKCQECGEVEKVKIQGLSNFL